MAIVLEDFVNREPYLNILWQALRQQVNERILLVSGLQGIGKTYLLDEYRAECGAEGVTSVYIDFVESTNHNYLEIVRTVRNEFHGEGFEQLDETIRQSRLLGNWYDMPMSPSNPQSMVDSSLAQPGGRSGGIDFFDRAEVGRDVVGRDINYILQIIQRDDPVVQEEIKNRITEAFLGCLATLTAKHPLAFLFDAWELAPTDIRDWICAKLIRCILERKLLISIAVMAGSQLPDFHHMPRRIAQLTLTSWSEETVQNYWIGKRGLSAEELPHVIRLTKGHPAAVAMLADMQTLTTPLPA